LERANQQKKLISSSVSRHISNVDLIKKEKALQFKAKQDNLFSTYVLRQKKLQELLNE
jgi:hypothetical protein